MCWDEDDDASLSTQAMAAWDAEPGVAADIAILQEASGSVAGRSLASTTSALLVMC